MAPRDPILVLAPHTDDGEIGCGGAISRFVEEGRRVVCAAFSIARASVRPELPEDILQTEAREAALVLGIAPGDLRLFDFPVRHFPEHRQRLLQALIDLREEVRPQLVLAPSLDDIHQDHEVVAREALRAFKRHTILGYEEPWNNVAFRSTCFIRLERRHIERKIEALACYRSQAHRSYVNADLVWSVARMRGTQVERGYAEAFEVLRWVWD